MPVTQRAGRTKRGADAPGASDVLHGPMIAVVDRNGKAGTPGGEFETRGLDEDPEAHHFRVDARFPMEAAVSSSAAHSAASA